MPIVPDVRRKNNFLLPLEIDRRADFQYNDAIYGLTQRRIEGGDRMYRIERKRILNDTITLMEIQAPAVARKAQAGQFVIVHADERAERIPLTIADYDRERGTVTIIFQIIGRGTRELNQLSEGESLRDFVGPLGKPSHFEGVRHAAVLGGGLGVAIAYPQAKALHALGAKVDLFAGFRNESLIILKDELAAASDELHLVTDDGSNGRKGFVTDALREKLEAGTHYDLVVAIGPMPMMKAACNLTRPYGIHTVVSMNAVMIDGTGMCGCCRVTVDGQTKFACVDGPDFDGHLVDFDSAIARSKMFRAEEAHACNLTGDKRPKINMQPHKTAMPEQNPAERAHNFNEVALGYTPAMAINEAHRCLQCKDRPCVSGCPVGVPIPEFIKKVQEGKFDEAYEIIRGTNALPAVCGRVCPQETQCEAKCVRGLKNEPVAIGRLERFVADHAIKKELESASGTPKSGKRVAIVGSGPAGLSCAGALRHLGHEVTIFEALHAPGGVLMYGIPEFRLPKALVQQEIDSLRGQGADIQTNMVIGKADTLEELLNNGYDAVFVGSGAGLPRFQNIPGEQLCGVYAANEFLTRINLMKAYEFPNYGTPIRVGERAAVIGGGNVAMDAARCALRMGAKEVTVLYRRGEEEMPARKEEIHHAKEEGVQFRLLCNPTRILGDENNFVTAIECVEMTLGEPDASGRRRPIVKEGSEFTLPVTCVVVAIGNSPNPLIPATTPGLETQKWGGIIVKEGTCQTSLPGVFAGGDAVSGAATVILAMGAGKQAAHEIDEDLKTK